MRSRQLAGTGLPFGFGAIARRSFSNVRRSSVVQEAEQLVDPDGRR
jgi:hypothetical protein